MLIAYSAPAQNLFVANNNGTITQITPGGAQSTFASGLDYPRGLAFNSAGDLFEADGESGNIYEFTPDGARSTFASGFSFPTGLAFNSAGNLFVADNTFGSITKITPGGAQSTFASGLSAPIGLAFNSVGVLFEADGGSGKIYEFTPGEAQSTFASGLSSPLFLAFQPVSVSPPPLSIGTTGNQTALYWLASATNFILQTTTNLSSPNWTTVSNGTPIIGVMVTNTSSAAFFRLQPQ